MISHKKFSITVILITILISFLITPLFNYYFDPLQYFRKSSIRPRANFPHRFENYGKALHYDYEIMIMGTSMINSLSLKSIKKAFDLKPIKLNMAGSSLREQFYVVNKSILSKKVKKVIWEVNLDALFFRHDYVPDESVFPLWVYRNPSYYHYLTKYLLNIETTKSSYQLLKRLLAKKSKIKEHDGNFISNKKLDNQEVINFFKIEQGKKASLMDKYNINDLKRSFDENILSIINNNPNIDFILYFSPQSIYYLKKFHLELANDFKLLPSIKKHIAASLINKENVKLYDFQTNINILKNYDHYEDIVHHNRHLGRLIVDSFKENKYLVTKNNYLTLVEHFEQIILNFQVPIVSQ